jgi:hypothetical protein
VAPYRRRHEDHAGTASQLRDAGQTSERVSKMIRVVLVIAPLNATCDYNFIHSRRRSVTALV